MHLKRVKIFGFKTFAERTEFNVEGGLIAVVGPNGCGKSNLVDAILWGLGEGNARHLRAQTGPDVIFNGSSRRKAVGFAEVSLLFDNEDGALPLESTDVAITRRISRSGDSDYAINRHSCRQRDVYELLADSGLGRAGYAIVGQKEIDMALSASPEDRRGWIDEAAGVQRYRARKVESQKRLSAASGHLERVHDILRELESQREPLREEAEVAARYKSALHSLRAVESGLLVHELAKAVSEIEDLERRIAESQAIASSESQRAGAIEAEGRQITVRIGDVDRMLEELRERQQALMTAVERAEAEIRISEERLRSLDEAEKGLGEEAAAVSERIRDAEAEVASLQEEETKERADLEKLEVELSGAGSETEVLQKRLKAIEERLESARLQHGRRLKQQAERAHRSDRSDQARRELAGIEATLPDLHEALNAATEARDEALAAVARIDVRIEELESERTAIRLEDDREAQEARKWLTERSSLEGRHRGIEATIEAHEGLAQGTRAVLEAADRGHLQGRYVPVAEAVEVDREHALAIETALGASANDLIVDDESEAKAAIAWLKSNRAGRATFQPIPLMRPLQPSPDLRRLLGERGVVGRASELVECDAKHRPVFDSLLGRVLLVDDLDTALRLAKTQGWNRMVTLEGEVLHGSGAVTGGQAGRQTYGMVQRKAELAEIQSQIQALVRRIAAHEKQSEARARKREELESATGAERERLRTASQEASEARDFLRTLTEEQSSTERGRDRLVQELERLGQHDDEEVPEVDLKAIELERDEALHSFAARSADVEASAARLKEAEIRAEQAKFRVVQGRRRLEIAQEAERHRERRAAGLEPERDRLKAEIVARTSTRDRQRTELQEVESKLARTQERKRELSTRSSQLAEDVRHARDNALAVGQALHQSELNRARAEARRATSAQRLFEEYGISEEQAVGDAGKVELPSDAATVVNRLRRELRAMGDVNLGAIEAFERLTSRFDELQAQRLDILEGIEQVQAAIQELDRLTRDRFLSTFAQVQVAFSELFVKLFGGGEGKILLTHPDSLLETGVELELVLPGKKRQRLELLSGGERSLCATAFLFALLQVKPSPLVVLDEVDAPLDGRNVERFANLLREFSSRIQFIVITHNDITIQAADTLIGVTMQEPGVSVLVPVQLPARDEAPALGERQVAEASSTLASG
jgi:chromosome segregation protein